MTDLTLHISFYKQFLNKRTFGEGAKIPALSDQFPERYLEMGLAVLWTGLAASKNSKRTTLPVH